MKYTEKNDILHYMVGIELNSGVNIWKQIICCERCIEAFHRQYSRSRLCNQLHLCWYLGTTFNKIESKKTYLCVHWCCLCILMSAFRIMQDGFALRNADELSVALWSINSLQPIVHMHILVSSCKRSWKKLFKIFNLEGFEVKDSWWPSDTIHVSHVASGKIELYIKSSLDRKAINLWVSCANIKFSLRVAYYI